MTVLPGTSSKGSRLAKKTPFTAAANRSDGSSSTARSQKNTPSWTMQDRAPSTERRYRGKPTVGKGENGVPSKCDSGTSLTGRAMVKSVIVKSRRVPRRRGSSSDRLNKEASRPSKDGNKDQIGKGISSFNIEGGSEELEKDGRTLTHDGPSTQGKKPRKPKFPKGNVTPGYTAEYEHKCSDFFSTNGLSNAITSPTVDPELMEKVVATVNRRKADIDEYRRMSNNRDTIAASGVLGPILDVNSDYLKERESMNVFGENYVDAFFEDDYSFEESDLFLKALEKVRKAEEKKKPVPVIKEEEEPVKKEVPAAPRPAPRPRPVRIPPPTRVPPPTPLPPPVPTPVKVQPPRQTVIPLHVAQQSPPNRGASARRY